MRLCGFVARVTILIATWAAPATSFTGVELSDLCFRKGTDGQLACTSYVRGFADGVTFEALMVGGDANYCPPQSLPVRDMRVIVEKYLKDHPDQLGKEAGALVGFALHHAFPCKRSN